ncbi:MAG: hypothetical protein QXR87_04165 [Candidatus Hadarchaeales archaeon]
MKGKVVKNWKDVGLTEVICDFLLNAKPLRVFGFFARKSFEWYGPSSKYGYFFEEGLKRAKERGLRVELGGCFYNESGKEFKILRGLGKAFSNFMGKKFARQSISEVIKEASDNDVKICFKDLTNC